MHPAAVLLLDLALAVVVLVYLVGAACVAADLVEDGGGEGWDWRLVVLLAALTWPLLAVGAVVLGWCYLRLRRWWRTGRPW